MRLLGAVLYGGHVSGLGVRERGLVGTYFRAERPAPAVVVLGGSDGGRPSYWSRLLASAGYSALALSYFKAPGVQRRLVEVPVDQVASAAVWLLDRPEVTSDGVAVLGVSKGAELALAAAAFVPTTIRAVVAYAPSAVVFEGIAFGRNTRLRSSWTLEGRPLPFVPYRRPMRPAFKLRGLSLVPIYTAALENRDAVARAAIPIECSDAAILLLSGGLDSMWPSAEMAEMLLARLAAAGKAGQATHVHFDQAGHSFMPWQPNVPSWRIAEAANQVRLAGVGLGLDIGGRPKANRAALEEGWRLTLELLDSTFTMRGESTPSR